MYAVILAGDIMDDMTSWINFLKAVVMKKNPEVCTTQLIVDTLVLLILPLPTPAGTEFARQ